MLAENMKISCHRQKLYYSEHRKQHELHWFLSPSPTRCGESAGIMHTRWFASQAGHARVGTPPLTSLLFVPDRDITSPLKTACCEHVIGKGQDKASPAGMCRNTQDLWQLLLVRATSGLYRGSELLVVGEISDFSIRIPNDIVYLGWTFEVKHGLYLPRSLGILFFFQ